MINAENRGPATGLPRKLIVGLVSLGFGAVFGVIGMFLLPYTQTVSVTLIALGGISAVVGVVLVMKFAGDSRFQPPEVVTSSPVPTRTDEEH